MIRYKSFIAIALLLSACTLGPEPDAVPTDTTVKAGDTRGFINAFYPAEEQSAPPESGENAKTATTTTTTATATATKTKAKAKAKAEADTEADTAITETIEAKAPSDTKPSSATLNRWWEHLNDPLLNSYVDRLLQQNLDIKQASERVIQARERLNTAQGSFFPSLGVDASASRTMTPLSGNSSAAALAASSSNSNPRYYSNSYGLKASTSWQIDLFGKIRRSVQAADASYQASLYDREALTHSLIAELLNNRIAVAVNKRLLDLAVKNADNRKKVYDIVRRRYDLGLENVSAADVFLAEQNYKKVRADRYQYERALAYALYNLDVILGNLPGTTDPLAANFPLLPPPQNIPVCLPADLLDRRPDLQAAKLRVQAAKAGIGVAMADMYPSLNLAGSLGVSSNQTTNLLSADQLAGSLLGSITNRIFEGGALRSAVQIKKSEARELSAAYAQDILGAVREVETALKNEHELTGQLRDISEAVAAQKKAEKITEARYLRGIESLRNWLDTQQALYTLEQGYIGLEQQAWDARINLILALGGDWTGDAGKKHEASCGGGDSTAKIAAAQTDNKSGTNIK